MNTRTSSTKEKVWIKINELSNKHTEESILAWGKAHPGKTVRDMPPDMQIVVRRFMKEIAEKQQRELVILDAWIQKAVDAHHNNEE